MNDAEHFVGWKRLTPGRWNEPDVLTTWAPLTPPPDRSDARTTHVSISGTPRYARMPLAAEDYDCVRPVALIAA